MGQTLTEKIELKFNIPMLDRVIIAVLTTLSNKKFIKNVNELFSYLKYESYKVDIEKEIRVYLIRKMTELIISKNLNTKEELLTELNVDGRFYNECVELLNQFHDAYLSPEDLDMVDQTISSQLRYGVIERKTADLIDLFNNIKAEAYDDFNEEISKVEDMVVEISNDFRNVRASIEETKYDIDLSDDLLLTNLQEIIDDENNPSHKVQTGIQAFNEMLGGGFEPERLYCFGAVAKGFKSGLMLNVAMWAKKYNKLKPKDPSKVPTILYVSMENTIKETIKRTCVYNFGNEFKPTAYTAHQLQELLQQSNIASKEGPHIKMIYRPDKSISTYDLNGILEDMEKDGQECVFLILDYLNRIRPASSNKNRDNRFELSDISNELATIAKVRHIPVLTATQMNREAFRLLEEATSFEEKIAAANRMGASQIGEAIAIVQNVDMFIILNRIVNAVKNEQNIIEYEDKFLMLNCVASRGNTPKNNGFQIRFANGNDLRLMEDYYETKPLTISAKDVHINERVTNNNTIPSRGFRRV